MFFSRNAAEDFKTECKQPQREYDFPMRLLFCPREGLGCVSDYEEVVYCKRWFLSPPRGITAVFGVELADATAFLSPQGVLPSQLVTQL